MMAGNNAVDLYQRAKLISVEEFGHTLVVAPHPDDEALGCGGTIALLKKAGCKVDVIFVSDGSMSHPASVKYPKEERILLREKEAIEALQILGVDKTNIIFMRLKDSDVPGETNDGFKLQAVLRFIQHLQAIQPATILAPWRLDPHKDHRATAQIIHAALIHYSHPVRVLEYFIWLWERSQPQDLPISEIVLWKINIEPVTALKQKAILAHQSQVTRLIDDDPNGFILSPEVLAHFSGSSEIFAESLPA